MNNVKGLMGACPNLEMVVVGDKPATTKAPRALAAMTPEQCRVLAEYAREDGAFRVNKDGAARIADAAGAALRMADAMTELAAELASVTLEREKLRDNVAELVRFARLVDEALAIGGAPTRGQCDVMRAKLAELLPKIEGAA